MGTAGPRCAPGAAVAVAAAVALALALASGVGAAKLQVHIVPHSHDDVGWLKTIDQYATGMNNTIFHASTNSILDTVVDELTRIPPEGSGNNRTFVYSEQAFFQRWWRTQDALTRTKLRALVREGRFEFVNGGWCMHDEAAAHYVAMVDQTTLGHAFLLEQFGVVPTTGWQLDPFGHSATQATLLSSAAGLNSLFFGRSDYRDLRERKRTNATEMIWRPSVSGPPADRPPPQADLFTVAMDFETQEGTYGPPLGFCFDTTCGDDPMQDDPALEQYNVDAKVDAFVAACEYRSSFVVGDNIMFMFGNDFNYQYASDNYSNMDKLIRAVNADGRVNVFYSTPKRYVDAKHAEHRLGARTEGQAAFPVKGDDFFPYADQPHAYWTGYFTSRPTHKFYNRYASAYLQTARQIDLMAALAGQRGAPDLAADPAPFEAPNEPASTAPLSEALGIAQHHDAVTGTGKQHVADDWARRIAIGMRAADGGVLRALPSLVSVGGEDVAWQTCHMLNVSACDALGAAGDGPVYVLVHNSLGRPRAAEALRLPVPEIDAAVDAFTVTDLATGRPLPSRLTLLPGTAAMERYTNPDFARLLEFTPSVPALGFGAYEIRRTARARGAGARVGDTRRGAPGRALLAKDAARRPAAADVRARGGALVLENAHVAVHFSADTGGLERLVDKESGADVPFAQDFAVYGSFASEADVQRLLSGEERGEQRCPLTGDEDDKISDLDAGSDQNSGAYIFRNNGTSVALGEAVRGGGASGLARARPLAFDVLYDQYDPGAAVAVVQQWSEYVYQTVRLAPEGRHVEFEFKVGPIPTHEAAGREVVTRYRAGVASGGVMYTDSNGRGAIKRVRNERGTFDVDGCRDEPVSCNYFPINTHAYIADARAQLTVLTDRAQGAASLEDGEIEVMLHRRILVDDNRGVAEALNETEGGMTGYPDWQRRGRGLVMIGRHRVALGRPDTAARTWKPAMQEMFSTLTPFVGLGGAGAPGAAAARLGVAAAADPLAGGALPAQLEVMTLQALSEGSVLLRLQHQYEPGEDEELGTCVDVDVAKTFGGLKIGRVAEVSLTNNQSRAAMKALRWRTRDDHEAPVPKVPPVRGAADGGSSGASFRICPTGVRTFVLTLEK